MSLCFFVGSCSKTCEHTGVDTADIAKIIKDQILEDVKDFMIKIPTLELSKCDGMLVRPK